MLTFGRNTGALRRANFDLAMEFLGPIFGMPMFAYLLLRSKHAHATGKIHWKGRTYSDTPASPPQPKASSGIKQASLHSLN
jgi:hypothetical protein